MLSSPHFSANEPSDDLLQYLLSSSTITHYAVRPHSHSSDDAIHFCKYTGTVSDVIKFDSTYGSISGSHVAGQVYITAIGR